jgi:hypothetical protein
VIEKDLQPLYLIPLSTPIDAHLLCPNATTSPPLLLTFPSPLGLPKKEVEGMDLIRDPRTFLVDLVSEPGDGKTFIAGILSVDRSALFLGV